jgi:tetratricopeptide (TPR) repeat protein
MEPKTNRISFFIVFFLITFSIQLVAQKNQTKKELLKIFSTELYKNPDNAIVIATTLLEKSNDNIDEKIKAYKLISDAYSAKRDYEKAIGFLIKANELLHLTSNNLLKITISNKTGILYHQLKIFDKATQALDQAEQLILEYPIKDSIYSHLGKNYIVRGFIYKQKLNPDIAIEFFDKGINELQKVNQNDVYPGLSIAKYNKGNCYILLFEYDKARLNFKESFDCAAAVNAESLKAFALKGLAKVEAIVGNHQKSIELLNEAKTISSAIDDLILNKELFVGLSAEYLALNQWDSFKATNKKVVATQRLINERERKSIESSLVNKESEIQAAFSASKPTIFGSIIFIICLVVLSLFVFFYFKRKNTKQINELKADILKLQNEN